VSSYRPVRKPTEVHHIFYIPKLSAFKSISNLSKKSFDTFWFLNDIRNELSHRNSLSNSSEDKDLILYEQAGFVNSRIDFNKLSTKEKEIFKRGKFAITKREKDFTKIYESLEDLKKQVIETLINVKQLPNSRSSMGNANPILQDLKNKLGQE